MIMVNQFMQMHRKVMQGEVRLIHATCVIHAQMAEERGEQVDMRIW